MKPTVVIPTYNRADKVRAVVQALLVLPLPDLDILIVDDQSPDGTEQIADQLAIEHHRRTAVLQRTESRGLTRASVDGIYGALAQQAEGIAQRDCDFSHAPHDVLRLLARWARHDVVVGSRYVAEGDMDEDWEPGRVLLSRWADVCSRLILRSSIRDITAGFKAWRRETLLGVDLDALESQGYVFQIEMAYVTTRLGYHALELPSYFGDRRIGESKMTMPVKQEAASGVWRIWWRHHNLRSSDRLPA